MSAYQYDSNACLEVLHQIADEIASGVSDVDQSPTFSISQEFKTYHKEDIALSLKKQIDTIWKDFNVPKVMNEIAMLDSDESKSNKWGVLTGADQINALKASYLLKFKDDLNREINQLKNESIEETRKIMSSIKKLDDDIGFSK